MNTLILIADFICHHHYSYLISSFIVTILISFIIFSQAPVQEYYAPQSQSNSGRLCGIGMLLGKFEGENYRV
jgi:hypothetical protein